MRVKKLATISMVLIITLAAASMFFLWPKELLASDLTVYTGESMQEIEYDVKVENVVYLNAGVPTYSSVEIGGCGPTAASMAFAYYDQTYPNIYEYEDGTDFESTGISPVTGYITYRGGGAVVNEAQKQLSKDMGRQPNGGVTMTQMKSGMDKYLGKIGLQATYRSVMATTTSLPTLSFSAYKAEIDAGRPVILGLTKYHLTTMRTDTLENGRQKDTFNYLAANKNAAPHVETGFGYMEVFYYERHIIYDWVPTPEDPFNFEEWIVFDVLVGGEMFLIVGTGQGEMTYLNALKPAAFQIADDDSAFSVEVL